MALKSFAGPRIILGTEKVTGVQCVGYIKQALAAGYRMFDTAQVYNNEEAISQAISSCNVPRNQIYVSTKIAKGFKKNPSTTRGAKESVHGSLQRFGLDYFDAVMIHHPGDDTTDPAASDCRLATWQALVELHEQRLVRNIGVSNFSVSHLRELLQCSRRFPSFNQVELHPWCQQPSIVDFCKQEGILLQAHSALARNQKSENLGLLKLAKRYGASPAQVLLRYSQQNGCVPVVKATSMQHLRDNAEIERFKITPEDMKMMQSWDEGLGGSILPWLIEGYQE